MEDRFLKSMDLKNEQHMCRINSNMQTFSEFNVYCHLVDQTTNCRQRALVVT